MHYTTLGRTGIKVSPYALRAMAGLAALRRAITRTKVPAASRPDIPPAVHLRVTQTMDFGSYRGIATTDSDRARYAPASVCGQAGHARDPAGTPGSRELILANQRRTAADRAAHRLRTPDSAIPANSPVYETHRQRTLCLAEHCQNPHAPPLCQARDPLARRDR